MDVVLDIPHSVKQSHAIKDVTWPEGWPIPSLGAPVFLRNSAVLLIVDSVEYYPEGNFELGPFVEVILKEPLRRPQTGYQYGNGNVQVNSFH